MNNTNQTLSKLQRKKANGTYDPVPKRCFVTGGSGFVGRRLVEMLVERGAELVISFDIKPKPKNAWDHPNIQYIVGDICDLESVCTYCKNVDVVFHIAALVGPFHPKNLYKKINYLGTLNVIDVCKLNDINKIVMSSSPSTRFDGSDIDGLTENDLPSIPMKHYMQEYAETKALGEIACRNANSDTLFTVAVAPHTVYGPRDNLFLPNMLEAAGNGSLRIFGDGNNKVCMTHVDNYCHGLILSEKTLYKDSPTLGKFYIVSDGETHDDSRGFNVFWDVLDDMIQKMGFTSLYDKFHLPLFLLYTIAYVCVCITYISGIHTKLNPFNVRVLSMDRWFRINAATSDLKYQPIIGFREGWGDTGEWFKENWLPGFQKRMGFGLSNETIDENNKMY
jgi:nucleoside-diphosphate-sugar epimerase